jgi:G3E family GTPase
MPPTPTNLFTGFLGVGKTTAILDLLQQKPPQEKWAVLVNEFGEVGLDGAIFEGSSPEGVTVREVGGGCFCCTTAPYLPVALHFLFVDQKPDRLLIETSGLGHPAGIIDTLRSHYRDRLALRATIGLVAPADFTCDGMLENPVFRDQVQMADVLILNKVELAKPETVAAFQHWANSLFPPKLLVAATSRGHLDPAWLDLSSRQEGYSLSLQPLPTGVDAAPTTALPQPEPGKPIHLVSSQMVQGWIFHPNDRFDEEQLLAHLGQFAVHRLKAVVHVDHEWITINRVRDAVSIAVSAYRRDSRIEIITDDPEFDWPQFEQGLRSSLLPSSRS